MKKAMIFFGLVLLLVCQSGRVSANSYLSYQEVVFENDQATLLRDYTDDQMKQLYRRYMSRTLIGWKVMKIHHQEPVEFISETKLRIVNNGYSTIKHTISMTTKEESKFQITASGDIGIDVKGDIKKFKGSVDASIKTSIQYTKSTTKTESSDFVIIVDPGTVVTIRSRGQGIVNNGLAMYYILWMNTLKGGWETFIVTTEYFEIVKEKL